MQFKPTCKQRSCEIVAEGHVTNFIPRKGTGIGNGKPFTCYLFRIWEHFNSRYHEVFKKWNRIH